MKKIIAKIDIQIGSRSDHNIDGIQITVADRNASKTLFMIDMSKADFMDALGRQGALPAEVTVVEAALDTLGKKMVNETVEFIVGKDSLVTGREETAKTIIKQLCSEPGYRHYGWIPDTYFNSQNSFFTKEGMLYARATVRKYVEPNG